MALTTLQVQQLYLGYYGRPADPVGLAYWQTQTLEAAKAGFAASAEFTNQYVGMSVEQQVNQVYINLLGREADLNGLLYWSNEIVSGRETIGTLVMSMQEDALGRDVTTLQMRTDFSANFTLALDTTGEVLSYSGQAAAEAARAAMANIVAASTGDTSTLTAALAKLDATVAEVVAGGGVAGQTFTLTAGADHITGTAGNDTINALTIKADGTAATTFSAFEVIDGGAGTDTLNVYSDNTGNVNNTFPSTITVKNVEIVNILNANAAAAGVFGDASKYEGVQQLWQVGFADNVTKLAATTTAGFRDTAQALSVTAAATAASVSVVLDEAVEAGVAAGANDVSLTVVGDAVATVNVTGTLKDGLDADKTENLDLDVTIGENLTSVAINSAVATTLTLNEDADTTTAKTLVALDASGSTGSITFAGLAADKAAASYALQSITTGSGNDVVTVDTTTAADNTATAADETVTATVVTGAGNDKVTVTTDGTGITSVSTGDGNDEVTVTTRGTTLTVDMGAGDDKFDLGLNLTADDTVTGGAGTDTLTVAYKNGSIFGTDKLTKVTGIEKGELTGAAMAAGNAVVFDVSKIGATTAKIGALTLADADAAAAETASLAIQGIANNGTVELAGNLVATTAAQDTISTSIAVDGAQTRTDDVLNLKVGAAAAGVTIESLSIDQVETVKIESVGGANTISDLILGDDTTTITLSGSKDITITAFADTGDDKVATIDASAMTANVTLSDALTPGTSVTSVTFIGGSKIDTYTASGKADKITGNGGADSFTLGAGVDTVIYKAKTDSTSTEKDTIANFTTGQDVLKFEGLLKGTFSYLGTTAFTNTGNSEARFADGTSNDLLVDVDGNGSTDMVITLTGVTTTGVAQGDFVWTA